MSKSITQVELDIERLRDLRHAVKNDISVIIAFAQLMKLKPDDQKTSEYLTKIEQRAQSILQTIEKHLSTDQ